MKGLMLTLVLLSWTGMVVAQQSNLSRFKPTDGVSSAESRFGAANKDQPEMVPITGADSPFGANQASKENPNDRVKNAFSMRERPSSMLGPQNGQDRSTRVPFRGGNPGAQTTPAAPFTNYLKLGQEQIDRLLHEGQLPSDPFDSREHARIQISDQAGVKVASLQSITPQMVGKTLVFQLSSDQLKNFDQYTFQYDVPAYQRGLYNRIVVQYPETLKRISNNRVAGNVQPASSTNDESPRWRLPGAKDPNHNPMLDDRNVQNWPPRRVNQQTAIQKTAYQTEQERLQRQRWERERANEADAEKRQLADQNRILMDRLNRLSAAQSFNEQKYAEAQRRLQQQNYADNSFLAGTTQPVVPRGYVANKIQTQPLVNTGMSPQVQVEMMRLLEEKNDREIKLARMEAKNQLLENKLTLAGYENRDPSKLRDQFNGLYENRIVDRDQSLARNDTNSIPGVNVPTGDRPLMSVGGIPDGKLDLGANGQTNTNDANEKANQNNTQLMMFVLLLLSVGLNLYLWFVARSFHSRYEELANELRETFTATV